MCVLYNIVNMGTVSNSNNAWHMLICVVVNSNKKMFNSPGVLPPHTYNHGNHKIN